MEYYSCGWIESRVVLDLDRLRFCCIPHSGSKGYVKVCDYRGGPLPVDAIREARRRLREANNDPRADSPCKGCHLLEKRDWDAERPKALLDAVYVSHYSICNLRCRYCYVYLREGDLIDVGYEILPLFRQLVADGLLAERAYVEWGGGEPTILKEFPAVQALLREHGHRQQVSTSGVRFSPEIEQGLRERCMAVVTSVDAGTRETYLRVKGRDRLDAVWENLGRYAATGGDVTVKYILRTGNSDERDVRAFVERLAASGVRKLVLTPDQWEVAQGTVTEETIFAFALLKRLAGKRGVAVMIRDEYAGPEVMRRLLKYDPVPLTRWRYDLRRLRTAVSRTVTRVERNVRRRRERPWTLASLRRAEELLRRDAPPPPASGDAEIDPELLALLERQVAAPDDELRGRIVEIVRRRPELPRLGSGIVPLGFSADGWTVGGRPAYLVVDGRDAERPYRPEVWMLCNAGPAELPVRLTLTDGEEEIRYAFLEPERRRFELPEVPPGGSAILAVRTDRTWSPGGSDPRRLGVRAAGRT